MHHMPTALMACDGTHTRMPTAAVSSLRLLQSHVQCSSGIRRHLQSHAHCPMASTSTYIHMPITFLSLYRQLHSHAQHLTLLTTGICTSMSIDSLHTADTCTHLHTALFWDLQVAILPCPHCTTLLSACSCTHMPAALLWTQHGLGSHAHCLSQCICRLLH